MTSGTKLKFSYGGSINNMTEVLTLDKDNLTFNGNDISIGLGENQFSLSGHLSPQNNSGQAIAFGANGNTFTNGWTFTGNSTNNGGAIIQGDNKGNLFFINRGTSGSNTMTAAQTAANTRMVIGSNGNIGIGTSTPNKKLHVNNGEVLITNGRLVLSDNGTNEIELTTDGIIHGREITVDLDEIPDYVFEADYDLMPLATLQNYIKANHHLPNIKSAKEYEETGHIALKELSLKLLEKVEELTLYTLEQEQTMKVQQEAIKTLQEQVEALNNKN